MNLNITELNALPNKEAEQAFLQCCTASCWVRAMVDNRPFTTLKNLQALALQHWTDMAEKDFLEAFEGHPKIGDLNSLRTKYANTKALASGEQGAVNSANELTLKALTEGNRRYETKNGFIFIVCATGKNADEMLTLLTSRLKNDRATELKIAAEQQSLITAIRITKLLKTEY
ncbi:MAG: 2-oxo-4-hydroxy-4-carboxy-5-ureidoimidazoline decarboxylase [Oleiphilaceae bacterium]|jgi:2-oxo-4-hydroxy-4-carboxy-5-ureidoimidazoline decarboxylase